MVYFVGAGPGGEDLITVRGLRLLESADVIVYTGSLVNPALLENKKEDCRVYNSARMNLGEVIGVIARAEEENLMTVRLHTGDPCLYGAIREQMDLLAKKGISFEVCPGVSSFCGAAASLNLEYTLPGVSQTVIITRMEGRTPVPRKEKIRELAGHGATMVVFLSAGMVKALVEELTAGGYPGTTPAAIVYKATWPEEKRCICTLETLAETAKANRITKTALIIVGHVLGDTYEYSKLYDAGFTTEFRKGTEERDT